MKTQTADGELLVAGVDASLVTIGRIFLSIPFLVFGLMHFMNAGAMAGVVPGWLPGGVLWVYLTGAANLAAGAAIATGWYVRAAAVTVIALLSAYILMVHVPGLFAEGGFQMAMQSVLKDTGLLGGAILLYAAYK